MNRTRIEWTDYTWNPVTGCLSTEEQCAVRKHCYARRTAKRLAGRCGYPPSPHEFEPTLHPERLEEPYKVKKPSKIFVCSMGELFGPWVPREWQEAIFKVVEDNPQHIFQFLTKFPENYPKVIWPDNCWLGLTLTGGEDLLTQGRKLMSFQDVLLEARTKFISAEPLQGLLVGYALWSMDWLIIGAQTNPKRQPQQYELEGLLAKAAWYKVPIFMKDNLDYKPRRREWPTQA